MKNNFYKTITFIILTLCFIRCGGGSNNNTAWWKDINFNEENIYMSQIKDGSSTIAFSYLLCGTDPKDVDGCKMTIYQNNLAKNNLDSGEYYSTSRQNVAFLIKGLKDGDSMSFSITEASGVKTIYIGTISESEDTYAFVLRVPPENGGENGNTESDTVLVLDGTEYSFDQGEIESQLIIIEAGNSANKIFEPGDSGFSLSVHEFKLNPNQTVYLSIQVIGYYKLSEDSPFILNADEQVNGLGRLYISDLKGNETTYTVSNITITFKNIDTATPKSPVEAFVEIELSDNQGSFSFEINNNLEFTHTDITFLPTTEI